MRSSIVFITQKMSDAGDEALRHSFWIWFLREKEVWGQVGFSERPVRPNPEVVLPSL